MEEVAKLLNDMVEAGAVDDENIADLAETHGLTDKWQSFQERFIEE